MLSPPPPFSSASFPTFSFSLFFLHLFRRVPTSLPLVSRLFPRLFARIGPCHRAFVKEGHCWRKKNATLFRGRGSLNNSIRVRAISGSSAFSVRRSTFSLFRRLGKFDLSRWPSNDGPWTGKIPRIFCSSFPSHRGLVAPTNFTRKEHDREASRCDLLVASPLILHVSSRGRF